MPRKSGIRFFYELHKNKDCAKIPVVIVTGHARDERVRKEIDELFAGKTMSGPQTSLEKPVKPEDYVNVVKRELGIEITESAGAPAPRDGLWEELSRLLEAADPETLAAAMKILKDRGK